MGTREWTRGIGFVAFSTGLEALAAGPFTLQVLEAPSNAAYTLVRSIVDFSARLVIENAPGSPPEDGWWTDTWFLVAVGADVNPGFSDLQLDAGPDHRIVGTGMAPVTVASPLASNPAQYVASYTLTEPINSKGQRKQQTPGVTPCLLTTYEVAFGATIIDPSWTWEMTVIAYQRALWELA